MPDLLAVLRSDLRIRSEADAETVRSALMSLYPESDRWDGKKAEKGVLRSVAEWALITGTFFRKWKGFVLRTDEDGKIVAIDCGGMMPEFIETLQMGATPRTGFLRVRQQ